MNTIKIKKENSLLVAIDYQEKLMPAIEGEKAIEEKAAGLIKGARILEVPILITQQYTKGLGKTVAKITEALGEFDYVEKNTFSCMKTPEFANAIFGMAAAGRKTIVLCGVETHICVQQTALDLLDAGFDVFVVADCSGSRTSENNQTALARMTQAGAFVTTYESVLYEWLESSKTQGFKEISQIVK